MSPRQTRDGTQGASLLLTGTRGVGSSSQIMSAPILPQEGPTLPQARLGHQNKHLLRANVSQALQAPLSQILGPGGGREKTFYQNCHAHHLLQHHYRAKEPTRLSPHQDLRPESPGTTGPAPSCSPAMSTTQLKTLACFPGGGSKKILLLRFAFY